MDDLAISMKEIQTEQDLLCDLFHEWERKTSDVVMPLDETEKRLSEDLEHHADVNSIGTCMPEGVEKLDDVVSTRVNEGRRRARRGGF